MSAPWSPTLVASEFLHTTLVQSSDVLAALGGRDDIYPRLAPANVAGRHLTYEFYGPEGGRLSQAQGFGIVSIEMTWAITGWEPSYDDFNLRTVMEAAMAALLGPQMKGTKQVFGPAGSSQSYQMECWYGGPSLVPIDLQSGGPWTPARELFRLLIAPLS